MTIDIPMAGKHKLESYQSPRVSSEVNDCALPLTFDVYSKCSMNCSYCVPKDSNVTLVDGTTKKVQDVVTGDVLLGYNEKSKEPEATVVEKTMNRKAVGYLVFNLDNGGCLRVTDEHPLYTNRGWVAAKDVCSSDLLLVHANFAKAPQQAKKIEIMFYSAGTPDGASAHRLYAVWSVMVQRCHYPTNPKFSYYGLRGIQVCEKWRRDPLAFFAWAESNGFVDGLEIDRIDNDGDYSPDNCHFVTHKVNSAKRRLRSSNSSGFIGVYLFEGTSYRVSGMANNSVYSSPERAAIIRDRNLKENHMLNFQRVPEVKVQWCSIEVIRKKGLPTTVYNFECWPNNNYFTSSKKLRATVAAPTMGVLVHNCFAAQQQCIIPGTEAKALKAVNVQRMLQDIDGKSAGIGDGPSFYEHFYSKRFILHWGGLADAGCLFEKRYGVGYQLLQGLAERKYPTLFSFKGRTIMEDKYLQLFDDNKHNNSFAFQLSITTADDKLAKVLERGVPSPTLRFAAMKAVSDMGYFTILRLRPYIIGVTDKSIDELLQKGLDSGMQGISTEFYAMSNRAETATDKMNKTMGELMGTRDITKHFVNLSPKTRGPYCRLNRHVKEPYIRKIYEFCAKHNLVFACSDPDFKELSTSNCCCALPDEHPINPEFNNFNKNQSTRVIKDARRLFHTTGERAIVTFEDTYGTDYGFLDSNRLSRHNFGCTQFDYGYRSQITTRDIVQAQWNTILSPASPHAYYNGKLLPIGVENDNLVFQYNPSEYEIRWAAEGVDMLR
jgi:DNA repair photolyase